MRTIPRIVTRSLLVHCLAACTLSFADTHYVDANSTNAVPPYTNWTTAATVIQDAVDAAEAGDTVLVTNGVYDTGGSAVYGTMTNRVAVNKAIVVSSVNGPDFTSIAGQGPLGTNAIRCAYVTNGAQLVGFTLTNGFTKATGDYSTDRRGGGVWCEDGAIVSNCVVSANSAHTTGGGIYRGTVKNSTIVNNSAAYGGGVSRVTAEACILSQNFAEYGGGAEYSTLDYCTIRANSSQDYGGGMYYGIARNCIISSNTAAYRGGGSYYGDVFDCVISGNTALSVGGGGTYAGTVQRCTIAGNFAPNGGGGGVNGGIIENSLIITNAAAFGGGARSGTIRNCTIAGNVAQRGGGTYDGTVQNSIVYYNEALLSQDNHFAGLYEYCCTTPDPVGVGNITNSPGLLAIGNPHIVSISPCVNIGKNLYVVGPADIDGELRISEGVVDIGCDEIVSAGMTGDLVVAISMRYDQTAISFPAQCKAVIEGKANQYTWQWGDGQTTSNELYVQHYYGSTGMYEIVLTAWNNENSASATAAVQVVESFTNHVSTTGSHIAPFATWANAATNIQAAIDANPFPGGAVLVSDGVYDRGGAVVAGITNRVALIQPVTVMATNQSPEATLIVGQGPCGDAAVRCAYVGEGALLIGFTLTNGCTKVSGDAVTERSGGGAWCDRRGTISNCVIRGSTAISYGGGALGGEILACLIEENDAFYGGGTAFGEIRDCTVINNEAVNGGGAYDGLVVHSVIISNTASSKGGGCLAGIVELSTIAGNEAFYGGGGCEATLQNCFIRDNWSVEGGGTYECVVDESALASNSADNGGGSAYSTVRGCDIISNSASLSGGGAYYGTIEDSTISSNTSTYGGGVSDAEARRCVVSHNASTYGGGAYRGTIDSCFLTGNSAQSGGGAYYSAVTNCTIVGNCASYIGGGTVFGEVHNTIVYFNTDQHASDYDNYQGNMCEYSCTKPLAAGTGNISADPSLLSLSHYGIAAASPCVNAGSNVLTSSETDIEGDPRIYDTTVDIGCDEYFGAGSTGTLIVAIVADYTNAVVGASLSFEADISGKAIGYAWQWGDGESVTNICMADHAFGATGIYPVVLSAWNHTGIGSATVVVHIAEASTNYVSLAGASIWPYGDWATAAASIQEAIDAAIPGGTVLVAEGVYEQGEYVKYGEKNRIGIDRNVTVKAASDSWATTVIKGSPSVRCAYIGNGAQLLGFTLTGGSPGSNADGGGTWCEASGVVSNCSVIGNTAAKGGGVYGGIVKDSVVASNLATYGSSASGGGTWGSVVRDCVIVANSASFEGGGTYGGTVDHCVIASNTADYGGGASRGIAQNCAIMDNIARQRGGGTYNAAVRNCTIVGNASEQGGGGTYLGQTENSIVYYNTGLAGRVNYLGSSFEYCCTTPVPEGPGNITNEPGLLSIDNWHVVSSSSCLDAGNNDYAAGSSDLDNEPRIHAGTVDIGCDEFIGGGVTGELFVGIIADYTNCVVGSALEYYADISGKAIGYVWSWADGSIISNLCIVEHTYTATGVQQVVLSAWNESVTMSATATVHVLPEQFYYAAPSGSNVWPYADWGSAATNIQDAIDAAIPGATVFVGEGTYEHGTFTKDGENSRIGIYKDLSVIAVGSREYTSVRGGAGTRCVYVGEKCRIAGFTLADGQARDGGGAWCEVSGIVSNCLIIGNAASYYGGGTYSGTVIDSLLVDNVGLRDGGGAYFSILKGCVVSNNVSDVGNGGGAYYGQAVDSIIISNTARVGGGANGTTLQSCALVGNVASMWGGGVAWAGLVQNCLVMGNQASGDAGGTYQATVYNCTIVDNSAGGSGGGCYNGRIYNSIVYYNMAGVSYDNIHHLAIATYSCSDPHPGYVGNIPGPPEFVDAGNGNYRLRASSPCIDEGINEEWMLGVSDLDGNARILNGTVDMGAYETPFYADVRVFLGGPYDTNTHAMTGHLGPDAPLNSPYAVDSRVVTSVPPDVTDWVLVELQNTNEEVVASESAFLKQDGSIVNDGGGSNVLVEVSPGDALHLVVKHRNHLATMSADPQLFTNLLTSYDFTLSADQHYGGTNAAIELEPGVWGMPSGDADGDGVILDVDGLIYETQSNLWGYHRADFNLDGVVSNDDHTVFWAANLGRQTAVPHGEVILSPALGVEPHRLTLLSGESNRLTAAGVTGEVFWAFVQNPSGGSLTAMDATSVVYQAGANTSSVDIVEAWTADDLLGRSYLNVISEEDVARAGKAIIIAGRKDNDDPLWPVTDYLADLAYNTLRYRGYSKANIQYLSPEPAQDVDGDGALDDVDAVTTFAQAAHSFTNWAASSDRLFVYLDDHGGDAAGAGYFRLNATETLTAVQLDAWLDGLQDAHGMEVIVVLDFCQAGSFLDELTYHGTAERIVIAACAADEPTYFVAGGLVSFSDAFFSAMLLGLDLNQAFELARDAMATYQQAWLDDNKDGIYELGTDGQYAATVFLGASFIAGKDIPQIANVFGNQLLQGQTAASLGADDIAAVYPIERVWCLIVPPGHDPDPEKPVADLVELELAYDPAGGRYRAVYSGFSEEGSYKVIYYARDIWGSVSLPAQSYVTQAGFDDRVVLVAGGPTTDVQWVSFNNMANLAYHTLLARWFEHGSIYYMNPVLGQDLDADGTNDVDALPTLTAVANAITNWAAGASRLTVYLVGEGTNGAFRLNGAELLSASDLDLWLDTFQQSNQAVSVIMEFPESGGFLPQLRPPAGKHRISVANCADAQPCSRGNGGLVSFTQYFLSDVFSGYNVDEAFGRAKQAIRRSSGRLRQDPKLDDDGDGVSSKDDGAYARLQHIGPAFVTGADVPTIGAVPPDQEISFTSALALWASGVTDVDGISNVWCVVTPPDYGGTGDLPEVDLAWNGGAERYEGVYTNLNAMGTYTLTFHAMDTAGEVSSPVQTDVLVIDVYEPDDTGAEATAFEIGTSQEHNLHSAADEDWIKFFAVAGTAYEIEAEQLGTNTDLRLEVFFEEPGGVLTNIDWLTVDDEGKGTGLVEATFVDSLVDPSLSSGIYHVRVASADTNCWGEGSEYELRVFVSVGAGQLVVIAVDSLDGENPPPGAVVIIEGPGGVQTQSFGGSLTVDFPNLDAGIHTVRVTAAAGYFPEEDPQLPGESANLQSILYGNPKEKDVLDNTWQSTVFQFVPYGRVEGEVRDDWTGAWLEGAQLAFRARNGRIEDLVYDGYPNFAEYKSNWFSQLDGSFPTNVYLPAVDWDLTLTRPQYTDWQGTGIVANLQPGAVTNLGAFYLAPLDTNTNLIADDWEVLYFGPGTNVVPGANADGDRHDNRIEYLLGTDPKDPASGLRGVGESLSGQQGFRLTWPVAAGRVYRVRVTEDPTANPWPVTAGPWTSAAGQVQMEWIDTTAATVSNRFYAIDVLTR